MVQLEKFTMTEIVDYYVDYIINNCELATSKSEAKKLFLNALAYNVVRESVVEQVEFLKEES